MTITIPVVALLDCTKAVNMAPIKNKRSGKLVVLNTLTTALYISGDSLAETALLIVDKPKNNKPKPVTISPKFLIFSFLKNIMITPTTANKTKYLEKEKDDKDAIKPVTVVPIYAPKITDTP